MTTNLAVRLATDLMVGRGPPLWVRGAGGGAEPMSRWGGTR